MDEPGGPKILDNREKVQEILRRVNPTLRNNLNPSDDLFVKLRAAEHAVLSQEEYEEVIAIQNKTKKIDKLIDLLKVQPVEAYLSFMAVLREKDLDLHNEVKGIEDEYLPWEQVIDPATHHKKPSIVDEPDVVKVVTWKQLDVSFSTEPELLNPTGIVIRPNGDVAVTRSEIPTDVKIFSKDGIIKNSFDGSSFEGNPLRDIAITPSTERYLLSGKGKILVYDSQGKRLKNNFLTKVKGFSLFKDTSRYVTTDTDNEQANPVTLDVDIQGFIIAGLDTTTISVYKANGELVNKFKTKAIPRSLDVITTSSKKKIAVVFVDNTLQIMDYEGKDIREIEPPKGVDQTEWCPSAVCCSTKDEIFVVNHNTVYRYQYRADGDKYECRGRIISGLDNPKRIAITSENDKLYVTENSKHMVTIFERPRDVAVTRSEIPTANVKIFSKDGIIKNSFDGSSFEGNPLRDIAITPSTERYLLSGKGKILVYDSQGKRLKNIFLTKVQSWSPWSHSPACIYTHGIKLVLCVEMSSLY